MTRPSPAPLAASITLALAVAVAVAVAVAGCGTVGSMSPSPHPSPSPQPSASPLPSPTPSSRTGTPEPSVGELQTSASTEHDGVRVTITLERNPLPAGEATWITTEVRNIGADDLIWFHDGCAISVGVWGTVEGANWRLGAGHAAKAADFKLWAMEHSRAAYPVTISFTPEKYIGRGRIGCADVGLSDTVPPGGVIRQRAQWDGMADRALGPAPSGPVELRGTFTYYWRATTGEPADVTKQVIEVRLDSWVVGGRDPGLLHPGEVVDAALADPGFAAWLESKRMRDSADAVLQFDPIAGVWRVGLLEYGPNTFHVALIEPRTGKVLDVVTEPWDPETDGSP